MGSLDKRKMDIKRYLKRQKTEVTKAKKIAETLLLHLQGAQERIDKTDMALYTIPDNVFDGAMTAIRKKKNLSYIKSQLEQLAHRVAAQSINLSFPPCSVKPARLPVDRQTRLVRRLTTKPVTMNLRAKLPSRQQLQLHQFRGALRKPLLVFVPLPLLVQLPSLASLPHAHFIPHRASFPRPQVNPPKRPSIDVESDDDNMEE